MEIFIIVIVSSLISYNIGAYYGGKVSKNIEQTEAVWNELATSGEICHKCANAGVTACDNCGHYSWDEIYTWIKQNGGY